MEVVVAYFKVLFQHLPGGNDENHVCQDSQLLEQELNPGPLEFVAGMFTMGTQHSVHCMEPDAVHVMALKFLSCLISFSDLLCP